MMTDSTDSPTVFVVDDDPQLREAIALLLESVDIKSETFASAPDFLESFDPASPGCLVLDVRMPEMSGLELQRQLVSHGIRIPILLLTAHAEVPMAVEAMKAGALDFIEKPYAPQILLDHIQHAIAQDTRDRHQEAEREALRCQFGKLTDREREVLDQLVLGNSSKEIAFQLAISATTVDFHRRNLFEKLGVETKVELGRLYEMHLQFEEEFNRTPAETLG